LKKVTNTLWGIELANNRRHGIPYRVSQYTTLNEKQGFRENDVLAPEDTPVLKFLAIGNKGHRMITSGNNIDLPDPVPHLPDHAALYNQIPFCVRPVNNDLTAGERSRYAGRTRNTVNGVDYYYYWLKRLNVDGLESVSLNNQYVNGVRQTSPFIPTADCLNPTPPLLPSDGAVSTSGEFLSNSVTIDAGLDENDVRELYNVSKVIYGDERHALISEMAFCHGVDRVINVDTTQGSFNFLEAIGVQVDTFYSHYAPLTYFNKGFDLRIEFGGAESLLGTQLINTVTLIPRP
jgi:hypothetical protein